MRKQKDIEMFGRQKVDVKFLFLKLRDEIDLGNISSVTSLGIL